MATTKGMHEDASMALIEMHLEPPDLPTLVTRINDDDELGWLVGDGAGRWHAVARVESICQRSLLWHVPSGRLPLRGGDSSDGQPQWIDDPAAGWDDPRPDGYKQSEPYFGGTTPGVYSLSVSTGSVYLNEPNMVGLASFGWIGTRYSRIGHAPHPVTEKHWRGIRRWLRTVARPTTFEDHSGKIWVFPAAEQALLAGAPRDDGTAHVRAIMAQRNPIVWSRA